MSIYLDVSAAVHRRAGLGRYAESLARAMAPYLKGRLALFYNREQGVEPLDGLTHLPTRTVALGYKPWRMLVWLGQLARIPFNRLVPDASLFHAAEHLLLPLRDVPTVLTIHDLIFHHLPEHHKPLNRWYLSWTLPLYCRRADHVIAVSEATRRDLVTRYALPPAKVTVVPEAADPRFRPQPPEVVTVARARYDLPEDYVLYVGTIEPRKNLTRLLHAWGPLYRAGEAPPLVIVGKRGWLLGDFDAALAQSPAHEGVHLLGYVRDGDLAALYTGAMAFVFPSLFEGFGLPPLEAMACGTPVACADASSLPEVVGDAALRFDPTDEDAIAAALRRLVNDPDLRQDLRARGLRQAARFSWDRAARETLAIYDSLRGNRCPPQAP
jgi:glycosyltransferase involved in cell wall biosynthesis